MEPTNKDLMALYMLGFNDELDGVKRDMNLSGLLLSAYKVGRWDAITGDDISWVDLESDEEKLRKIRQTLKNNPEWI